MDLVVAAAWADTAEPEKLRAWRGCGIERVSMGIQVIQPDLLKILARDGNGVEHHQRAVEHIRAAGFARLNIDVMYGFADQSVQSLAATIAHTVALSPEYITLYRMRYKLTRISHQAPRVDLAIGARLVTVGMRTHWRQADPVRLVHVVFAEIVVLGRDRLAVHEPSFVR